MDFKISSNEIRFTVTKNFDLNSSDWVSILLNPDTFTMRKSDFHMAYINASNKCEVIDGYADKGYPTSDKDFNGTDDIFNVKTFMNDSVIVCKWSRKLVTNDPYDVAIENRPMVIGIAHGYMTPSGSMAKHVQGVKAMRLVNLLNNNEIDYNNRYTEKIYIHAMLMFAAFFLLFIPSGFLARYFKFLIPQWFLFHWITMTLGSILVVVSVIVAFWNSDFDLKVTRHTIMGVVVVSLFALQIILGYFSNKLWYPSKPPHLIHDKLHWYLSRIIFILYFVTMSLGIAEYSDFGTSDGFDKVFIVFFITVAVVIFFVIIFETFVGQKHEYTAVSQSIEASPPNEESKGNEISLVLKYAFFIFVPIVVSLFVTFGIMLNKA
jgi:hypothetical protein